ncbi:L-arabinose ABC transporter ATP-binding protein AraG [Silvimonas sp. JCM 19000]
MNTDRAYLAFRNISKVFPGVKALQDISFSCGQGSIHALMGENGAGKSTLLKILSGMYQPSGGHLEIGGQKVEFNNTLDALNSGVAIIYQELHLAAEMSVAENIFLGQLPHKYGVVDRKRLREMARERLQHLGMNIDPDTPLRRLSIAQWQMVEIAKALTRNAQVIAFDEPTSSLSAREIEQLFRVIRELQAEGRVILYVSHRMEEIFHLCDAITVFKDGRYVNTWADISQVSNEQLVQAMVGRELGDIYGYRPREHGEVRLDVRDVLAPGLRAPASLQVKRGEIVGLFGLVGAGRSELMKAIFGASPLFSGQISVDGKPRRFRGPGDAIAQGVMLCPEDRKAEGIVPVHSVRDNINISARRRTLSAGCLVNEKWERSNAQKMVRELNIKTPSDEQLIMNLSGGNQQKAILGRWLSEDMKIMLLDEPTRGIDVGAKHEIYRVIYDLAEHGISVLFASSDLPEALGLADRIIVMREGRIVGELTHDEATEQKALALAMLRQSEPATAINPTSASVA